MRETTLILEAAARAFAQGEEAVVATVVRVEGSVYRRPGARLLISANGETVGSVSGGCLESDLVRKAWWRTEDGPSVVVYDSTADEETAWQLGLGCNGVVHVLLERIASDRPGPLAFVRRCAASNRGGVMATAFRADIATGVLVGERLTIDVNGLMSNDFADDFAVRVREDAQACLARDRGRSTTYQLPTGEVEVAFEVIRPPIRLIVFGGGFDVSPVVHAGRALGWATTVVNRRRATASGADHTLVAAAAVACERLQPDGRTAAVVMNHHFSDDRDAVAALLQSEARYIGVLGPKARTERILSEINALEPEDRDRLHAPIGLDIGADTPEEIASAIVAEIVAVFAGRPGSHLRDRSGPIHRNERVLIAQATP